MTSVANCRAVVTFVPATPASKIPGVSTNQNLAVLVANLNCLSFPYLGCPSGAQRTMRPIGVYKRVFPA